MAGPSPAVLPQPETPTWRCKRCGSDRWVAASLTGPDGPAIKQCIPCGRYSGDRVHSPAVLPEKPREACSTCGEPMDSLGCSKDPDDDRPRAIAGFHTIAGGCSVAEPVSGVAGNPDKDGAE